jgi:hypothetical protein
MLSNQNLELERIFIMQDVNKEILLQTTNNMQVEQIEKLNRTIKERLEKIYIN